MGRLTTNPWAKKSAAGMRTLSKMTGTAYKVGKAVYKSSSQNPSRSSRPVSQQQQPQEIEWTIMVGLLGGMTILLIIVLNSESTFFGILLGLPAMFVSAVVFALILSLMFPKNKAETSSVRTNVVSTFTPAEVDMTIAYRVKDALVSNKDYSDLSDLCKPLSQDKKKASFAWGLDKAVESILEAGTISEHAEDSLQGVADAIGVSLDDFRGSNSWESLIKMLVIDDILHGDTPNRFSLSDVPLNLQKNETIIWCFVDVNYFEQREKRVNYVVSQGFSVKVAKGLYYRVGAFKGEPVITTEQRLLARGYLFLTNKNIYFYSGDKSIRVPYSKIVAYTPYEDGLGIQKDADSAKPMTFVGIDGWFAYNVVKNISNIE